MTAKMLNRQGYTVLSASTPGEAIRVAGEHGDEIRLLLSDVIMPEMDCLELLKNISFLCPNIKSLFMSGYTANVIAHHGVLMEGIDFIQKPFSVTALASKVREVLDRC
jgi:DNA-binding NtrC family response regulator